MDSIEGPLTVPAALFGTYGECLRQARAACKAAVAKGSWTAGFGNAERMDLADSSARIVIHAAFRRRLVGGAAFHTCVLNEALHDASHAHGFMLSIAATGNDYGANEFAYPTMRDLVLAGMDELWFNLCALEASAPWFPNCGEYARERPKLGAELLRKVLRYWDALCELYRRNRFELPLADTWQSWGSNAVTWAIRAGMGEAEWRLIAECSAEDAGKSLRDFLRRAWPGIES